jgi:hypothetical protein
MNETETTRTHLVEAYLGECENLAARGVSVLDPAEVAQLADTAIGSFLLERLVGLSWGFKGDDRDVQQSALKVINAAEDVKTEVAENLRVRASISGETWVASYARDLQVAVDRRQAHVTEAVQMTFAARKVLEG